MPVGKNQENKKQNLNAALEQPIENMKNVYVQQMGNNKNQNQNAGVVNHANSKHGRIEVITSNEEEAFSKNHPQNIGVNIHNSNVLDPRNINSNINNLNNNQNILNNPNYLNNNIGIDINLQMQKIRNSIDRHDLDTLLNDKGNLF